MGLVQDYITSLKGVQVDEMPNLFIYRPLAFVLVKLLLPFPITPNQVSLLAIIPGVLSAFYFSHGDSNSFFIAGILLGLSSIFDCADGMIARLKKNGTKTGRLVDGIVDYFVGVSVYVGLALGLNNALLEDWLEFPVNPWILLIVAAISNIIHSAVTDYYRNLYDAHKNGKKITPQMEIEEFSAELERLEQKKGKPLEKLMIRVYLVYLRAQAGKEVKPFVRVDPREYQKHNRLLLTLWNLIGPATNNSVIIISALFYSPMLFFYYAIVFANLWMVILFIFQDKANKKCNE
jgi:phosphatidylglycerophosphate synthase